MVEFAKLARRDRQHFDCAIWLHKAREMLKEEFKQEVERELIGQKQNPGKLSIPRHTRASCRWSSRRSRP